MYLIDDDKHTAELEELTFAPGLCTDCGEDSHVYHDTGTDEYLCLDCLEGAVREEADAADREAADYWKLENARLARLAHAPAFAF